MELARPTALVTGASAGLGREYARALAARGADVVLVARRRERLEALAAELSRAHGVRCHVFAADLSDPAAVEALVRHVDEVAGGVELLVNNAGYGVPGRYLSSPWQVHADYVQLMVATVARLSYAWLPHMLERGGGSILNVASVAGFLPGTSGHTQYAAAKAWMINFSESLAFEYGGAGVRVCAVCPGFTRTEFHDVTGTRTQVDKLPGFLWLEAGDVVRQSLDAVDRGAVVFVPGIVYRLLVRVVRWLPQSLVYYLARRESHRFRDER
ncbi:MAG: SDR family NAD(P)-dependent oxidoreductase [Gammaproteobacteria bacterium]